MGQAIKCSYRIPESFSGEHLTDLDGSTTDDKSKSLSLSIEVESNLPVYSPRTIMDANSYTRHYNIRGAVGKDEIYNKHDEIS